VVVVMAGPTWMRCAFGTRFRHPMPCDTMTNLLKPTQLADLLDVSEPNIRR
jgi:hypothetical protein